MSSIDDMLAAHAGGADINSVDSLLAQQAKSTPETPKAAAVNPAAGPSAMQRFGHGIADTAVGAGQLVEHIAETPLNLLRSGIRGTMRAFGASKDTANQWFEDKSASDFDHIVQDRENEYQGARMAAGQTGIDWWRLGGNAVPLIASGGAGLATEGGTAATALGRIGVGAAQGAAANALQPSTSPGNFWWDKAKDISTGAIMGGAASGVIEGAIPALKAGASFVKKAVGINPANTNAAEDIVNEALRAKGIDPASINLNVLSAMKKEVRDAINAGADDVTHTGIANRAIAESLPVPINLMRGQASRDGMLFAKEQNLRGITGVGEPITNRLAEQNQAMIADLDALGAKNAVDPVVAGTQIQGTVQKFWAGIQQQKTQLYDAVKNSQGLSAKVDGQSAGQEIRETLGSPQAFHAWMTLPEHMKNTIRDLEEGKLDLTVSNLQALDKSWGADARAADGSGAHAINQARAILAKAEIQDDVGKEAMQAYQAAKQAHSSQMSLLEPKLLNGMPNPDYQPLVKAIVQDGKPPESIFQNHFMGAQASVSKGNLEFLSQIDPESKELISNTLMGEIKRQATGNSADVNPPVSEAVLRGWTTPVQSAKLDALTSPEQAQTFKNLAHTVEMAKKPPVASAVNTSNTGSAVANAVISGLKSSATAQVLKRTAPVSWLAEPISEGMAQGAAEKTVQDALKPGVTLKSLVGGTKTQIARKRALSRLIIPAAVAAEQSNNPPKD